MRSRLALGDNLPLLRVLLLLLPDLSVSLPTYYLTTSTDYGGTIDGQRVCPTCSDQKGTLLGAVAVGNRQAPSNAYVFALLAVLDSTGKLASSA